MVVTDILKVGRVVADSDLLPVEGGLRQTAIDSCHLDNGK